MGSFANLETYSDPITLTGCRCDKCEDLRIQPKALTDPITQYLQLFKTTLYQRRYSRQQITRCLLKCLDLRGVPSREVDTLSRPELARALWSELCELANDVFIAEYMATRQRGECLHRVSPGIFPILSEMLAYITSLTAENEYDLIWQVSPDMDMPVYCAMCIPGRSNSWCCSFIHHKYHE